MKLITILNELATRTSRLSDDTYILNRAYPVNSIYMSFVSTSPASFIGGSWEQITGRFLRFANDTSTGGADTVTLSTSQMPSHTHAYEYGNWTGTNGSGGNGYAYTGGRSNVSSGSSGSSNSHNNMPAYQDVYAWKRIA